jgi:hypothetical protein
MCILNRISIEIVEDETKKSRHLVSYNEIKNYSWLVSRDGGYFEDLSMDGKIIVQAGKN